MAAKASPPLDTTLLTGLYRQMLVLQHLEKRLMELSQQGVLRGSLHLATGQEALPAGACSALRKEDAITVTYRGHGYILAKGCDLNRVVAEILGKRTGLCKGKGGKMHLTDIDNGLLGANGIVGGGIATAVGAALSFQIDGADRVAMTVFGDGTLNQGATHEAMNMAALWKLPVIFLCENNLYAEMTPLTESTPVTELTKRMAAYDIRAVKIDGNDVMAVRDAVVDARRRAVKGEGPTFIEAMTYRTCGHYQNDPGTSYRTKAEVVAWQEKSPVAALRKILVDSKTPGLEKVEEEAIKVVEDAIAFAIASPEPSVSELKEDLFV